MPKWVDVVKYGKNANIPSAPISYGNTACEAIVNSEIVSNQQQN